MPRFNKKILNPDNITQYIQPPKKWYKIKSLAHKADYIRVAILYEYGGIYIDSDMIALDSFEYIYELLTRYEVVAFEYVTVSLNGKSVNKKLNHTYNIPISFLACVPKNILFKKWLDKINKILSSTTDFEDRDMWHLLGRKTLEPLITKLVENNQLTYYSFPAETTVIPVGAKQRYLFFTDYPLDKIISSNYQPFIALFNSWMPQLKLIKDENYINKSNWLVCKIFKLAINNHKIDNLLS